MKHGERHSILERQDNLGRLIVAQERLGEFLRSLRNSKKAGSLRSVADALGISHNYLGQIERGSVAPEDEVLKKLADFYRVDEFKLFEVAERVPYTVRKSLEGDSELRHIVYQLANDKSLLDKIRSQL